MLLLSLSYPAGGWLTLSAHPKRLTENDESVDNLTVKNKIDKRSFQIEKCEFDCSMNIH